MNFDILVQNIDGIHNYFQSNAAKAVNINATIRNWLIGMYIVEYEQNGEDRAKYGDNILDNLSDRLKHLKGLSVRNLWLFKKFYSIYPQILQTLSAEFNKKNFFSAIISNLNKTLFQLPSILQTLSAELESKEVDESIILDNKEVNEDYQISQTLPDQSKDDTNFTGVNPEKLITNLSFSHFVELMSIDDPLKRAFYEIQAIKGTWSVRELKRQIGSLLFERIGFSEDKEKLMDIVQEKAVPLSPSELIKDPLIFEFLNIGSLEVVLENDLETALLNHIQEFIIELGEGFCFEARQKKILIGGEYFFVDLVFYHRILKCHVLVELKTEAFNHAHLSQLNTYVSWYRKNIMQDNDKPSVGILLCTGKNDALVKYATDGMDEKLFVQKYMLHLPKQEELLNFINTQKQKLQV